MQFAGAWGVCYVHVRLPAVCWGLGCGFIHIVGVLGWNLPEAGAVRRVSVVPANKPSRSTTYG